jgi:hypothetical protein
MQASSAVWVGLDANTMPVVLAGAVNTVMNCFFLIGKSIYYPLHKSE